MTSLSTQKRGVMTQPAAAPTAVKSHPLIRRAARAPIDYKLTLLMWVAVTQPLNLFSILWAIAVPEASRGLVGLVGRDLHIPPMAIVALFLIGIGVSFRGLKPRYGLLFMLVGQAATAFAALAYTLHGTVTPAQFAGHGGLFVLNVAAILAVTQYKKRDEIRDTIRQAIARKSSVVPTMPRLLAPMSLIPLIGVILCVYGVGLALRPDAGLAMFIQGQVGQIWNDILIAWMAVGGGYILLNHIAPKWLFVAILSIGVYALMASILLAYDNGVSFTGIIVHSELFITMMFVAMIQIREYADAARHEARGAA